MSTLVAVRLIDPELLQFVDEARAASAATVHRMVESSRAFAHAKE